MPSSEMSCTVPEKCSALPGGMGSQAADKLHEQRDPVRPQFTDHCFTGEYPTSLTDRTALETPPRQLSLLAEAS